MQSLDLGHSCQCAWLAYWLKTSQMEDRGKVRTIVVKGVTHILNKSGGKRLLRLRAHSSAGVETLLIKSSNTILNWLR